MSFNLNRKTLNIIIFILIFVSGFYLLAKLYKLSHTLPEEVSPVGFYLITLFIIVLTLIQMLIILQIKDDEKTKEVNEIGEEEVDERKNKKEEKSENKDVEKILSLNIKEIVAKIVPNKLPTVEEYGETILINISKEFQIVQGIIHVRNLSENIFNSVSFYAYFAENKPEPFKEGETLPGQVARNKEIMQIDNIPDNYIQVLSGLGESTPKYMLFVPVIKDDISIAVIELASFSEFTEEQLTIYKDVAVKITTTINSYIKVTENTKNDKK